MDWLNVVLPGVFGLLGTGVGGWVTSKTQRQQLMHSDRAQWDKDIVKLVGEVIGLARDTKPVADRYWSVYFNDKVDWAEKDALDKEIDEKLEKMQSLIAQIQLFSSPSLTAACNRFYEDCNKRFTMQYEEVDQEDDGRPIYTPIGNDDSIDLEKSVQGLTAAVKVEIRLDTDIKRQPK